MILYKVEKGGIMKIYESAEDYLETILLLSERIGNVRSIDVVNELGFSKPSVSIAMKKLREQSLVEVDGHGHITLTPTGYEIAARIYERHTFITSVLVALGVDEDIAKEDACRMEHHLSEESYQAIKKHFHSHGK